MSTETPRKMIFTVGYHPDGTVKDVYVDHWADEQDISTVFLAEADPRFVRRDGDVITITCANGTGRYRVAGERWPNILETVRIKEDAAIETSP